MKEDKPARGRQRLYSADQLACQFPFARTEDFQEEVLTRLRSVEFGIGMVLLLLSVWFWTRER